MKRVVLLALVAAVCPPAPAAASVLISASVKSGERGLAIPRSFLGFSSDWQGVQMVGTSASGPNPVYQQLVANLARYGGGVPELRVGGNYQDSAWWNPVGLQSPVERGVFVNITPPLLQGLATNWRATHQRMILGINLVANDPKLAATETRAMLRYLPRRAIEAFEIGNEPDVYTSRVAYEKRDSHGRLVSRLFARKRGFSASAYLRQWERIATALRRVWRKIPLAGTAGYGNLVSAARFLAREHRRVALYTEHAYPLVGCAPNGRDYTPSDPQYPTLTKLLGQKGALGTMGQEHHGVAAAKRWHKPFRIDEMNSISCRTRRELAGGFGATLWALDEFFIQAAAGVKGINMHVDSGVKAPFRFYIDPNQNFGGWADPLYYAMLAFAEAAGPHGRLLFYPTLGARAHGNARVWAVRGRRRGAYTFVVLNKDLNRSGTASIRVPGARRAAELVRLTAPSPTSVEDVTFAGQAVAPETATGKLEGQRQSTTVRPKGGVYSFDMPRTSAALLTLR